MSAFFEALNNFKPKEKTLPRVKINGEEVEVSVKEYKEIEQRGIENYKIKDGKPIFVAPKVFKKTYEHLVKSDKGLSFVDGNPYWPDKIIEGGYTWQNELESAI